MKDLRLPFMLFMLSMVNVFSQSRTNDYIQEFISTEEGLSNNYVTSIVSDELNNKWFATENGITKFNGYTFSYIKPSLGYDQLKNENIEILFKGNNNVIWIGTKSAGLTSFKPENNEVLNYNHLFRSKDQEATGDIRINSIAQADDNSIWIGTWDKGIYGIDPIKKTRIAHLEYNSAIYGIGKGLNGDLWFAADKELIRYNIYKKSVDSYKLNAPLFDVVYDEFRNRIWVSCRGQNSQLFYFDYQTETIDGIETNVGSFFSRRLSLDHDNNLWIGTWGKGLYKSNKDLSTFNKIKISPKNTQQIKENYAIVLNVHHDAKKQVWVGTANAGVVKLTPNKGFKNASLDLRGSELDSHQNITAIYKDSTNLFIGTSKSGVFKGGSIHDQRKVKGFDNDKVNCFYRYKNQLFVGTGKNFQVLDLINGKIRYSNTFLNRVTAFHIDFRENLFIGTQQTGIYKVPLKGMTDASKYKSYRNNAKNNFGLMSDRITGIVEDSRGLIWVGTYHGLHLYDATKDEFIHHSKLLKEELPSVIINDIQIQDNTIWLGTPGGLIQLSYDAATKKLSIQQRLTTKDGLKDDYISSVLLDREENIWMSTATDIVKYNPGNQSFLTFGERDGENTIAFNDRSAYNFQNRQLYFGGINNITYFDPYNIEIPNEIPEIVFSSLRVNNEKIEYKGENAIIDRNFSYAKEIQLDSDHDFLSIGFNTNDFLGNLNVKYRYRLKEIHENWIDLLDKNEINFASLPAGHYQLQVAGTRDNQNWGPSKTMEIRVAQSPWLSTWAFFIYVLLTGLAIYTFLKFKQKQLVLKRNVEILKMEKEKEYEINETKLNFFTNISHEFRTPLTLMQGPLQELQSIEVLNDNVKNKINIVERNTNRLSNLINQLLDFRKAEKGHLQLNASEGNFVRFSNEVFLYFKDLAKEKGISYHFEPEVEELCFPFDRNKMEIALCNLLSNALKYSGPRDRITLRLKSEAKKCVLIIQDTGIGISSKNLDKIFDMYFQIKSASSSQMIGSGIGLAFTKKIIELHNGSITVKSKKNEGSEFTIKIGTDPTFYKDNINDAFIRTDNIAAYPRKTKKQIAPLDVTSQKVTILIIDDNTEILDYLEDVLSEQYKVLRAEGGKEGYDMAMEKMPDLIISDVMMPETDGITLCKGLKSHKNTSHIPIILLTARTSTVFEIEGLKTGADDYITKPFNPNVVKARITGLLQNRSRLKEYLTNKIWFEPSDSEVDEVNEPENAFIQKAMLVVENNLHNPNFGIDNLVEELHMSQSTLYRKMKSLTDLSLTAFIRSIRLKRAALLILTTDMNLSEIAYDVGFNDYKYFKTCFQKQFQCLPSSYKQKVAKN